MIELTVLGNKAQEEHVEGALCYMGESRDSLCGGAEGLPDPSLSAAMRLGSPPRLRLASAGKHGVFKYFVLSPTAREDLTTKFCTRDSSSLQIMPTPFGFSIGDITLVTQLIHHCTLSLSRIFRRPTALLVPLPVLGDELEYIRR
jgi:hypothetical protein